MLSCLKPRIEFWGESVKTYAVMTFTCPECGRELRPIAMGRFECVPCFTEYEEGTWKLVETIVPADDTSVLGRWLKELV